MGAPSPANPTPKPPWKFLLVALIIAVAIGATIGWLGITGRIGAGITGEQGPSHSALPQSLAAPAGPAAGGEPTSAGPVASPLGGALR